MKHSPTSDFRAADVIAPSISPEAYLRQLHPEGYKGRPELFALIGDQPLQIEKDFEETLFHLPSWLDQQSFVSLNRFFGRRSIASLAQLNALYVDLDFHTTAEWRGRTPSQVQAAVLGYLIAAGIPEPSVMLHTGRGLAAIWLIRPVPRKALERWQVAMQCLAGLLARFGADRIALDPARIFRIPGTINPKSGKEVSVSLATWKRHNFDGLCDTIFKAAGLHTRSELRARRKKATDARTDKKIPKGLTASARFSQIARDLDRIVEYYGGSIPEGARNVWLHLYGVCLSHQPEPGDIAARLKGLAAVATPGLKSSEVAGVIRATLRKAEGGSDGRYLYAGATIAERLGITSKIARDLGLLQIMPKNERRRRKAADEAARRRGAGAIPRAEWLAENSVEASKPWEAEGISRSTYYRRQKAAKARSDKSAHPPAEPEKSAHETAHKRLLGADQHLMAGKSSDETGPCPHQMEPKVPAERTGPPWTMPGHPPQPKPNPRPETGTQANNGNHGRQLGRELKEGEPRCLNSEATSDGAGRLKDADYTQDQRSKGKPTQEPQCSSEVCQTKSLPPCLRRPGALHLRDLARKTVAGQEARFRLRRTCVAQPKAGSRPVGIRRDDIIARRTSR